MMNDIIADYQKWKSQGEDLRTKAKSAMEGRFRELLVEAAQISEEYRADFGAVLKPPASITSFRYKAGGKAKKAAPKKGSAPAAAPAPGTPKAVKLQKRIETARKKLEETKAAGGATRAIEDKIYEMEDELRLIGQG